MMTTLIGYARCSTDKQDIAAQRAALEKLGVAADHIYTDHCKDTCVTVTQRRPTRLLGLKAQLSDHHLLCTRKFRLDPSARLALRVTYPEDGWSIGMSWR